MSNTNNIRRRTYSNRGGGSGSIVAWSFNEIYLSNGTSFETIWNNSDSLSALGDDYGSYTGYYVRGVSQLSNNRLLMNFTPYRSDSWKGLIPMTSYTKKVVYNLNTKEFYVWTYDVNNPYYILSIINDSDEYSGIVSSSANPFTCVLDSNGQPSYLYDIGDDLFEDGDTMSGGIHIPIDDDTIHITNQLIEYTYRIQRVDGYLNGVSRWGCGSTIPDGYPGTDTESRLLNSKSNKLYRLYTVNSTEYIAISDWTKDTGKFSYKSSYSTEMTYGTDNSWLFSDGSSSYLVRSKYHSSESRTKHEVCLINDSGLTQVGSLSIKDANESANTNLTTISHLSLTTSGNNSLDNTGIRAGFTYSDGILWFIYSKKTYDGSTYRYNKTLAYSTDFNNWSNTDISVSMESTSASSLPSAYTMGFIVVQ